MSKHPKTFLKNALFKSLIEQCQNTLKLFFEIQKIYGKIKHIVNKFSF